MTSTSLKLSVLIPSRSLHDPNLRRLLANLKRQTLQPSEIIIETQGNSEEAKALAIQRAQGEFLIFFCTDNELLDARYLETALALGQQPGIDGAYSERYTYLPSDTSLNRYFALLGDNEPLCWWLGRSDRQSAFGQSLDVPRKVTFTDATRLPSLGDNGFLCRASLVKPFVTNPATFGSCMDLWQTICDAKGQVTCYVFPSAIWHRTATAFWPFIRRRCHYVRSLYFDRRHTRRWHLVSGWHDGLKAAGYALASLLVVPQVFVALAGYYRLRDRAWGWHPLVCHTLTWVYLWLWARHHLKRVLSSVRISVPMTWRGA